MCENQKYQQKDNGSFQMSIFKHKAPPFFVVVVLFCDTSVTQYIISQVGDVVKIYMLFYEKACLKSYRY